MELALPHDERERIAQDYGVALETVPEAVFLIPRGKVAGGSEMRNIVVVDLDGTLCDCSPRQHHAQNSDWDAFHAGLEHDLPHESARVFVKAMHERGCLVVGCTGRPERYRLKTHRWLHNYEIELDILLMRPDQNYSPDHELKPSMLRAWFKQSEESQDDDIQDRVLVVLDDRDKVVEAWRANGFNCWQVREGGY